MQSKTTLNKHHTIGHLHKERKADQRDRFMNGTHHIRTYLPHPIHSHTDSTLIDSSGESPVRHGWHHPSLSCPSASPPISVPGRDRYIPELSILYGEGLPYLIIVGVGDSIRNMQF